MILLVKITELCGSMRIRMGNSCSHCDQSALDPGTCGLKPALMQVWKKRSASFFSPDFRVHTRLSIRIDLGFIRDVGQTGFGVNTPLECNMTQELVSQRNKVKTDPQKVLVWVTAFSTWWKVPLIPKSVLVETRVGLVHGDQILWLRPQFIFSVDATNHEWL